MKMFLSRLSANISRKRLEPCRLTAAQSGLLGCFNNNLTFPVKEQTFLLPSPENQQQKRFRWTKAKKKRQARFKRREVLERKGIPLSKPPYYTPRDTAVVNATSREKRLTEIQQHDEKVSSELQAQFQQEQEQETEKYFLRHHMTGLKMSDRVRKLFDLTNGSQKEVVQVQKHRGMSIFQLREGDTGSSAVQVIALTTRIQQLQTHMMKHKKDLHSKRGMDALYVRRRKVLDYMERKDFESYRRVVKTLGLVR